MAYCIDLQKASKDKNIPKPSEVKKWVSAALASQVENAEICVRIVDEEESSKLNEYYRHKAKPTNVLAFPCEAPAAFGIKFLGDIVICAPVVNKEVQQQDKKFTEHWAHIVIHGTLHLLGYDHIKEADARKMEKMEFNILKKFGLTIPELEVKDYYE